MTKEQLAKQIDGFEYPARELAQYREEAASLGLVIAYGMSDDLLECIGAIDDEVGAYNGRREPLNAGGLLKQDCECEDCPHEQRMREAAKHWISAEWCPDVEVGLSWRITASVPTATFRIMEDGEVYCEGIVFNFADLAKEAAR